VLFGEWRFGAFVAATILFSFAYNAAIAFLPLYLTTEANLASTTASLLYSVLFVMSLVQLGTGELSDRIGSLPIIVVTLALASVSLAAILLLTGVGGPIALGAAIAALGAGSHGYRPVRGAYLVDVIPESVAGGGLGVVRTLTMGAGAASPAIIGVLSETVGFQPAFRLLTGVLVLATGCSAVLWTFE
jgi:MFS family permease